MKITVCQLPDDPIAFKSAWQDLATHVKQTGSNLVLLPEMPFVPWFAASRQFDERIWEAAVEAHDTWSAHLLELGPVWVVSTRPVNQGGRRYNEGFVWQKEHGYQAVHRKYYLPDEEGTWEASWYAHGPGDFALADCAGARLGMLICTEVWAMEQARAYGKAGAQLIATPRVTQGATVEKWLAAGRTAAILAGAFGLSSNRVNADSEGENYGGRGWIVSPDGAVLGLTSLREPFVTVEIDLGEVERAKQTYPRYIF